MPTRAGDTLHTTGMARCSSTQALRAIWLRVRVGDVLLEHDLEALLLPRVERPKFVGYQAMQAGEIEAVGDVRIWRHCELDAIKLAEIVPDLRNVGLALSTVLRGAV